MNKEIFILFTHTGTYFSQFLGLFTKAKYNHVSICTDNDFQDFYSFGRKIIRFPLVSGFVTEHINQGVYKVYSETTCQIYRLEISEEQYDKLLNIINIYKRNKSKYGYNLFGLIGVLLNRPIDRKRKYFCSQFVGKVIADSSIYDFRKHYSLITPQDIIKIPNSELIYEGKLKYFNNNSYQEDFPCSVNM